jgi:hypothetical protein
MNNKKAQVSTDTPKWLSEKPTLAHFRDFEDAIGDHMVGTKIDPMNVHKDDIGFQDLLVYL